MCYNRVSLVKVQDKKYDRVQDRESVMNCNNLITSLGAGWKDKICFCINNPSLCALPRLKKSFSTCWGTGCLYFFPKKLLFQNPRRQDPNTKNKNPHKHLAYADFLIVAYQFLFDLRRTKAALYLTFVELKAELYLTFVE